MTVRLIEGRFFQVCDHEHAFSPAAEEIYRVLFEGATTLRGVPVSREDFQLSGVHFSEYVADPVLVLEAEASMGGFQIRCRFVGKSGASESEVAHDGTQLLDYALDAEVWIPLPAGAVEEAEACLRELKLSSFGSVTLAQYMKLIRCVGLGLSVEDRTGDALSASVLAPALGGAVPSSFNGNLYHYQEDGFRWLSFMTQSGLGAIIADEMGLGKTVQVACLLTKAKEDKKVPNLVVAPATLLENWRRELAKFGPGLRVLVHSGSRRTGYPEELSRNDVVVCSFDTAVADISLLRNVHWHAIVVDEAQNIKNPEARRTIQLKTVPRECAVAVTGTPVENRLQDLWSITDFVLPTLLGSLTEFERRHPDTVAAAQLLEPLVSPLILRRTVLEVAKDLPERIDIPQALQLDPASADTYEAIRAAAGQSSQGASLATLTKLRMFCTHPWLTGHFTSIADATQCSTKLRRLIEIMEEVSDGGGKVLVFTSYSQSVDLIKAEVGDRLGIYTDAIDGRVAVPDRQRKVDEFSSQDSPALLVLNPKAAGTGLNLTAANHVIHFNLEWNPAVEDQASARAHRLGQTRTVTVHRIFYAHTVEEVINDRMQRKRDLAQAAIVGTDGQDQDIDDVLRALRISPLDAD